MKVLNYRELIAWQKAIDLVEEVYRTSALFPKEECFTLTQQIRRAAVSIPSNIAEGQGRFSTKEFVHFLSIAHGSLREVETQAIIAQRLAYIGEPMANKILNLAGEVGRIVNGLENSLNK